MKVFSLTHLAALLRRADVVRAHGGLRLIDGDKAVGASLRQTQQLLGFLHGERAALVGRAHLVGALHRVGVDDGDVVVGASEPGAEGLAALLLGADLVGAEVVDGVLVRGEACGARKAPAERVAALRDGALVSRARGGGGVYDGDEVGRAADGVAQELEHGDRGRARGGGCNEGRSEKRNFEIEKCVRRVSFVARVLCSATMAHACVMVQRWFDV